MAKADKKAGDKPANTSKKPGKKGKKAPGGAAPIVVTGILKDNIVGIEALQAEKKAKDIQIKAHKNVLKDNGYPTTMINALLRRRKLDDTVRIDQDMEINRMEVEMGMETWVQTELALDTKDGKQSPEAVAQKLASATGKPTPTLPTIKMNPAFAPEDEATKGVTH